jgi:hypothetical protein
MRSRYAVVLLILAIAMATSAYILAKTKAERHTCQGTCGSCPDKTPPDPSPGGGVDIYEVSYNHYIVSSFR